MRICYGGNLRVRGHHPDDIWCHGVAGQDSPLWLACVACVDQVLLLSPSLTVCKLYRWVASSTLYFMQDFILHADALRVPYLRVSRWMAVNVPAWRLHNMYVWFIPFLAGLANPALLCQYYYHSTFSASRNSSLGPRCPQFFISGPSTRCHTLSLIYHKL